MQQVAIHTPQNVEIGFPVVDIGQRLLAKVIDYVIIVALYWILYKFLNAIAPSARFLDNWSSIAIASLVYLPVYTYSLWFETIMGGRTPGKFVMKMQVMRIDGLPFSWENALVARKLWGQLN